MTQEKHGCNSDISVRAAEILDDLRQHIVIAPDDRVTALDESHVTYLLELGLARQPTRVLEIGLGWGFSASAIQRLGSVRTHVIVELEQGSPRALQGERNVRSTAAAQETLQFHWGDSSLVLPKLHSAGQQFDLILIDGGHRFDDVFVDFHFCRRMATARGVVLLDDMWMPSVRTVVSWIQTNLFAQWTQLRTPPDLSMCAWEYLGTADQRSWDQFTPFEVGTCMPMLDRV
jgi:predicted O-methyltransferase YrrM